MGGTQRPTSSGEGEILFAYYPNKFLSRRGEQEAHEGLLHMTVRRSPLLFF